MGTTEIIQLILIGLTIIGLFISFYFNRKHLKLFTTQLKLNFFSEYTKRYQEIILNFPEEINNPDFDLTSLDKETKNRILKYMRAYFDLCSEEYNLHKRKIIDDDIWKNWEEGIKYTFSKKPFKQGWEIIKLDTLYYKDFTDWIENEILDK